MYLIFSHKKNLLIATIESSNDDTIDEYMSITRRVIASMKKFDSDSDSEFEDDENAMKWVGSSVGNAPNKNCDVDGA